MKKIYRYDELPEDQQFRVLDVFDECSDSVVTSIAFDADDQGVYEILMVEYNDDDKVVNIIAQKKFENVNWVKQHILLKPD